MSDLSGRTSRIGERPRSRQIVGLILVVALIAVIGTIAAWRNNMSTANDRVAQNLTPAATVPVPSPAAAPNVAPPSVDELQETVDALQSTQRQILDEIGSLTQKLAAEQGERKLLATQLGSLSLRLDELSAASASIAERAPGGQLNSRAKSR